VWTKSLFDTYIGVLYIYILPLFVYPTPLAYRECTCVDKVACSMYVYESMDIVATINTYSCYLICIYVSDIHILIVSIRECWYKWS